ncbi:pilus assembly protein PilC [Nitrosomonas supralitoralis]|uniref:Pilus assembly protein PilC n=2 Tax=Nitrosomonas supralitoralis TaxID=2116706 RepID=A0A2P7NWQ0_9PROT|nr:pilus assembly protein PilC [Nitrosomonas supralitoralis]
MKKNILYGFLRLKNVMGFSLILLTGTVHALPPLSNTPLFLGGMISPNVMFTLDDSGSMHFEIMPDDLITQNSRYTFPRVSGVYGSSDYSNFSIDFDINNSQTYRFRSSDFNKIYYNPKVRYLPWSNADGSLMSNANPTCAFYNPVNTSVGCRNLTVNNTQSGNWLLSNGTLSALLPKTFYPAVYYQYNGGNMNSKNSYTQVEIKSSTATYPGGPNRIDCAAAPTCTYNEEIQNFANWYTYYRSRILLARAGVGRAFAAQGNNMRVGFATINKGSSTIDGVATTVVKTGVRQFTGTDRTNFFTNLYGHDIPAAGTPLREAVLAVGEYFKRTDDKGPWGLTPGSTGGTQHECRQNYNILMTDGYWTEGSISGLDNSDNLSGSTITNHSSSAIPPTYKYTPTLPYSDAYSATLADAAMQYWKNDLRTDLPNKVPTNLNDPAFWQHMVTFTVGLGVTGTLTELPSGAQTWPNPTSSDAAKIDDLWHAAVNSRGEFFSAADPAAFADALTNSLKTIVSRTGSASVVAANSNSLKTNGRIYQAKFSSGDWSGQLLSIPINSTGVIGTPEWNAADVSLASGKITPATRVIITKGSSNGVAFEYGNLTTAQKAFLNKNASGTTDNCGPERVTFLRGDSARENATGTFTCSSSTSINNFRTRPTSKLGDIVHSGPFYVEKPSAGYSDVDHPGYKSFKNSYKDRMPMIYVGANDGMLHGFNACIAGVTAGCTTTDAGKEMLAYIPSTAYENLSRLTDKDYTSNHRYFVNGSPMIADVYSGLTSSWRTILVGGLNGGGQGYYALNITNPTDATKSAPTFNAANAANILLWEFTNADDADMGYSHNYPQINSFTGQAMQIVKMENNQWAVIVGNGYNSTGGKAVLYILFITGGEDGTWTIGTDYIKLIANSGTGNGLSTPTPFDSNGNGKVDVIYAGDIKGNLWKFDVSSAAPSNWKVGISGAPLFVSGTSKPIISPPSVSFHPKGGQLVLFGTGKYLETADTTSINPQTIYGVWDDTAVTTVAAGALVQQVITDGTIRTATGNLVPYSTTIKGWYVNLPVSGERITGVPSLEDGIFVFSTIVPSAAPCDFGGRGFVNAIDFLTGGMLPFPAFDTNRNRVLALDDGLSAGVEIGFSVGGVTRIRGHTDSDTLVYSKADGTLEQTTTTKGAAGLRGRITWRELLH